MSAVDYVVKWVVRDYPIEWKNSWSKLDQVMKFASKQLRDNPTELSIQLADGTHVAHKEDIIAWARQHGRLPENFPEV